MYKNTALTQIAQDYINLLVQKEHSAMIELRKQTKKFGAEQMLSPPQQLQLIEIFIKLIKPQSILEIGTFTGLSALSMALSSDDECKIHTVDVSESGLYLATQFWQKANVEHKIISYVNQGIDQLEKFKNQNMKFELAYIDADKQNNLDYVFYVSEMLSNNGIILVDNTLFRGEVFKEDKSKIAQSIHDFNTYVYEKIPNFMSVLLPIGDGLTVLKKNDKF